MRHKGLSFAKSQEQHCVFLLPLFKVQARQNQWHLVVGKQNQTQVAFNLHGDSTLEMLFQSLKIEILIENLKCNVRFWLKASVFATQTLISRLFCRLQYFGPIFS